MQPPASMNCLAANKAAVAAIDTKTGAVAFEVVIKNFNFSNPMIQETFNSSGWMDLASSA